jgi:hypothetical protein
MDGVDEFVQILGDFPALGSIIDGGVSNSLQANLTSSTATVCYEASGVNCMAKIESLISDIDLIVSGVNMDIEIAGNVGSCDLSGVGNVMLVQGSIELVATDGVNNEVRVNDASGVGCDPFPGGNFVMNTCSTTSEIVSLSELPCVSSARNIVCSWLEMGVGGICYCRESFEGVPVEKIQKRLRRQRSLLLLSAHRKRRTQRPNRRRPSLRQHLLTPNRNRCVDHQVSCRSGKRNSDMPVVWHGGTLTTKINFVDTIKTIKVSLKTIRSFSRSRITAAFHTM